MLVALSVPRLTVTLPCAGGVASLIAGSGPDVQSGPMSVKTCRDIAVTSGRLAIIRRRLTLQGRKHRYFGIRRGGRVAEGGGLLNRYTV
jgi:hypothetical protein